MLVTRVRLFEGVVPTHKCDPLGPGPHGFVNTGFACVELQPIPMVPLLKSFNKNAEVHSRKTVSPSQMVVSWAGEIIVMFRPCPYDQENPKAKANRSRIFFTAVVIYFKVTVRLASSRSVSSLISVLRVKRLYSDKCSSPQVPSIEEPAAISNEAMRSSSE